MKLYEYIEKLGEKTGEMRIGALFESEYEEETDNLPKDIQLDFLHALAQLNVAEQLLKKLALRIEENDKKSL